LGEDEDESEEGREEEDGQQPPLLADVEKEPEVAEEGKLGHTHGLYHLPMQLPQFQVHAALEETHWWFTGRREIVRTLLHRLLPPSPERRIVDVGCGTGGNTVAFKQEYTCIGIDPDIDAITFARERFPQCRFIQGVAPRDIATDLKVADAVLLLDVLEHAEEDRQLICDLLSAMKPGAFLLIMAPADPKLWSPHDKGFGHFRRYTLESFRLLWSGQPVRELLLSFCNVRLYWPIRFLRLLARARGKPLGQGDSDLALPPRFVNHLLHCIFAGEGQRLMALLDGRVLRGYQRGVSAVVVLQRV